MEKKVLFVMLVTVAVVFLVDLKHGDIIWAVADYLTVCLLSLILMFKDSVIVGPYYDD